MDLTKLRYAARHPGRVARHVGLAALTAWEAVSQERAFRLLSGGEELGEYCGESVPFMSHQEGVTRDEAVFLYSLVRTLRPTRVVETGVSHGTSSTVFLAAMQTNGLGRLTSIDLNPSSGDFVPAALRDRWDFVPGRSADVLPAALSQLGKIDVFFHDSDHSFENMTREFEAAWPALKEGGLLLTHDANLNTALMRFARRTGQSSVITSSPRHLGGIRKEPGVRR